METKAKNTFAPLSIVATFVILCYWTAVAALVLIDHALKKPAPFLDLLAFVLFSPGWTLVFTKLTSPWFEISAAIINSITWGVLPAIGVRKFFPWPLSRFGTRSLFIAMTLLAVLLGFYSFALH
jgi:hypothetical protein